ncbi:TRL domain-containing protein [Leptospira ellisii]|uniref:TRL domain-containing protein n=1 Tax=Leptospira ellisii TaxID=2023197 RepID=A0AAE4QME1_9LEPT|nr:TRL domain-containing protein [Leptospira ellisii]MDV6235034.1 TRL domain-containing protein [Leptospira ellisii]PKA04097.1 hypothetical protein CH375_12995 [Leptospira ellisii]
MNKKLFLKLLLIGTAFTGIVNCATMGVGGFDTAGLLYSDIARSEEYSTKIGAKEGKSCQSAILTLFAFGDASIPGAAKEGKISQVSTVAFEEVKILLGSIYRKNCTIVTGN